MRYYEIVINTPTIGGQIGATYTYSSQQNLVDNYSCLRINLDVYQRPYHQPSNNSHIKIWGVDLKDLNKSANFNPVVDKSGRNIAFSSIQVKVGMSKGLPYANPQEQGVIAKGSILQSFATWQGVEVGLDLILIPSVVDPNDQQNITVVWENGKELTDIITTALQNAYKNPDGSPVNVYGSFSKGLKYTENTQAQYFDLYSLSSSINNISKNIVKNPAYTGATITSTNKGFYLSDSGLTPQSTKQIVFTDVIGNLTWIGIAKISAKVIMRGDLNVGDYISFQAGIPVTNIINNQSQFRNNISFQGVFFITSLRHVGDSRSSSGDAWATIIEAVMPNTPYTEVI